MEEPTTTNLEIARLAGKLYEIDDCIAFLTRHRVLINKKINRLVIRRTDEISNSFDAKTENRF